MSAVTPVPVSRSPLIHLVTDPWIALSWPLLIFTGLISVLLMMQQRREPPGVFVVIATFLGTGYVFWSMYFGLAAFCRFVVSKLWDLAWAWWTVGCLSMISFGWPFVLLAVVYSWLGGGIYQFARRWWLLAQGQRPPFLVASRRVVYR
jgi:hypothetical protein